MTSGVIPIVFASGNPSKFEEASQAFEVSDFLLITMKEAGVEGKAVENGHNIFANARKKALYVHKKGHGLWSMAEDTGLNLAALGGKPGKDAATWAGEHASTAEKTQFALEQMKGKEDRRATFESCVVLVSPDEDLFAFSAKLEGVLLCAEQAPPRPDMPYSGIFLPNGHNKVLSGMTIVFENVISHRGKALAKARNFLERYLM